MSLRTLSNTSQYLFLEILFASWNSGTLGKFKGTTRQLSMWLRCDHSQVERALADLQSAGFIKAFGAYAVNDDSDPGTVHSTWLVHIEIVDAWRWVDTRTVFELNVDVWVSDPALSACSPAAQGVFFGMLLREWQQRQSGRSGFITDEISCWFKEPDSKQVRDALSELRSADLISMAGPHRPEDISVAVQIVDAGRFLNS